MALFDSKFYRPSGAVHGSPEEVGLQYEPLRFAASDGVELSAWWFPAQGHAQGTVVHCHGNAGNITGHYIQIAWLPPTGFNVLCFDYRGYGESKGRVTRAGTILDVRAAINQAMSMDGVDARTILLFGQSLGGVVAIVAAAERADLAGVAVDGAFSDYRAEVEWALKQSWMTRALAKLIARWGISRGYDAIDAVERVAPTPIFLLHGKEDRVCPWEMSHDLFERAGEPKELWLIPGVGHYEALQEMGDVVRPKLVRFFKACVQAASGREEPVPTGPAHGSRTRTRRSSMRNRPSAKRRTAWG